MKVNTSKMSDFTFEKHVEQLPTCIIFKDGKRVDHIVGLIEQDDLKAFINKNL